MKMKFSIAMSLAIVLALAFASLVSATQHAAYVEFTTDLPAPCQVTVLFISYTDPTGQPGIIPGTQINTETPYTLETLPKSTVTFAYDSVVHCDDGTTYNLIPPSPGTSVESGNPNSTTTVIGYYSSAPDDNAPVLTLPDDITVPASNVSGALVEFTATATDDIDGSVPVTCSPASGSIFPIGMTTVNCSATDSSGNTASGSFNVAVQYVAEGKCKGVPAHQILQPINADDSSLFKQGRVVPAKFRVCGTDGVSIGTPGLVQKFQLIQIINSDGTVSNVDQAVASATPHTAFRFGNGQWIFNISTKDLLAGNTYVYRVTLNDGSFIEFRFSLK